MKSKKYLKAKEYLDEAIELLKTRKGKFEQVETLVQKTINLIGPNFTLLKVVGEVNAEGKENVRAALEDLGLFLLQKNAYHAAMQSSWLSDILLRQVIEKKTFKHVSDNYAKSLFRTTFFMDFTKGMFNWFLDNFESTKRCFESAIFRVREDSEELVKYLEKTISLVEADNKFVNIFEIESPELFYSELLEIDPWEGKEQIKDIYEIKDPIIHSIPEVTDVIAGRGFCTALYAHYLRTIFALLKQLEDVTIDNILIEKIRGKFSQIKDKNEVVEIGEKFLFACINELTTYKNFKDIPKHRFARLMNLLLPFRSAYSEWMSSLLLKRSRKSFFEKNLLQLNNQIDPFVLLVYEEGISPRFKEKLSAYARIWIQESKPEGESITKTQYDALISDKKRYDLIIVVNGRTEVYVGKEILNESLKPIHLSILKEAFKNKGNAGDVLNLMDKIFGRHADAQEFVNRLKKAEKLNDLSVVKKVKADIYRYTGFIRTEVTRLNNFMDHKLKLNVELKTERKWEFKFSPPLNYLYIELANPSYKYPSS